MATNLKGTSTTYVRSYHSFSGSDIKAVFGGVVIGTLQALSYAITREKAPIYTMGSPDPRAFSRGKRAIAGSMVFIMFDKDPLLYYMKDLKASLDNDEVRWDVMEQTVTNPPATANPLDDFETKPDNSDQELLSPWYEDQVPPFDIDIFAANEYGAKAKMSIKAVEITDVGHGMSVDDVQLGKQLKWIGRYIMPWASDGVLTGSPVDNAQQRAQSTPGGAPTLDSQTLQDALNWTPPK